MGMKCAQAPVRLQNLHLPLGQVLYMEFFDSCFFDFGYAALILLFEPFRKKTFPFYFHGLPLGRDA
jgi:hypothetical protein